MKKQLLVSLLFGMLLVQPVFADRLTDILSKVKAPVRERTTRGVVQSIDLGNRTAIISGFLYDFGPNTFPLKVRMYKSDAGAVELLRPGMKVDVVYGDFGATRLARQITQLADDTKIQD